MILPECRCEADVLDAVAARRWPNRVDDELRAHVLACQVCADVAEVASAIGDEHDAAWIESAALPSAHSVWLRAQSRARAEAARQAERPIAVMQALGLAGATAVISLLIGVVAMWVWTRVDWVRAAEWLTAFPDANPLAVDAMSLAIRGTLLAIGLWLVLAPVAVYLVASDD